MAGGGCEGQEGTGRVEKKLLRYTWPVSHPGTARATPKLKQSSNAQLKSELRTGAEPLAGSQVMGDAGTHTHTQSQPDRHLGLQDGM